MESPKAGELYSLAQMSGEQLQSAIAADNSEGHLLWLHALATGLCVRQAVELLSFASACTHTSWSVWVHVWERL